MRVIFYLILILSVSGCMLKEEIQIDFPENTQKHVVEAYLQAGKPYEISMMETNRFSEDFHVLLVWNADVFISGDQQEKFRLKNILYKKNQRVVNYTSAADQLIVPEESNAFDLLIVTKEGDTLRSQTHTVPPVEIGNYELENQQVSLTFLRDKASGQDFYTMQVTAFQDSIQYHYKDFYDLTQSKEDSLTLSLKTDYITFDSLYVELQRMTKENYNFQRTVQRALISNIDPFSIPTAVEGNIEGGQGIFTYYTSDSLWIK